MAPWFWYAFAAAVFYGLHQVFTKFAAERIGSGIGGFVVEATAAACIAGYLLFQRTTGRELGAVTSAGLVYSGITGLCVGIGTVLFFLLFQKGGPLQAVPVVLAAGAALMAVAGIVVFKEPVQWQRLLGVVLSLVSLYLLHWGANE
ncbi:EamA family transporter [Geomesophilobacter sediminis]|uniref:EamA family transporter n=1 Tax=Geomesophilobacter sediminis TaxID=2798584 RepID=A0A8J7LXN4_9BACT|nr:EamA family transporter [Geomesophilobacter sediminis]MBJ6723406.1 EamA family transporter [Geomesophilobacter sediminis]